MTDLKGLVMQRNALRVAINLAKRCGNERRVEMLREELELVKYQIDQSGATATEIVEAAQSSDIQHHEKFDFGRPHWETKHGRHRI